MSITLETVLGATKSVDQNSITSNRVGNLENSENNGPLLTANFVRNIWTDIEGNGHGAEEEVNSYVVINRPENLGQLLLEKYGKDEWDLASVYMMEEKARVAQHNNRERQKVADWQKREKQKIEEWESRGRAKIEEWERREKKGQEEYQFDIELRQEDAKKLMPSFLELVLDALEARGRQVAAYRSQLKQDHWYGNRIDMLKKSLSMEGVQDKDVVEDIVASAKNRDYNVKDSTKAILVKQLGLVIPEIIPQEQPPPYEPTPRPKPEPRPIPNPRPEIKLKEVPPLLDELETVVMSRYNGQSLESLKLTHEAWDAAVINPQEVRDRITKDVIPLTDQYLLVRVVGKSEKDSGSLNLLQIISNRPSVLKPYFIAPFQAAFDAYVLAANVYEAINTYFEKDEEGQNIIKNIIDEKQPFFKRTIVEEMLNRTTPLVSAMFPNWYAVVIAEEEPARARVFRENLERTVGLRYDISQKWYATNVTQAELQHYRVIATDVIPKIKDTFAREQFGVITADRKTQKDINDLAKIIDLVRSLVDAVPGEYFELMEANEFIGYTNNARSELRRIAQEGKILKPSIELLYAMRLELGENYEKKIPELESKLGRFLMKGVNQWQMELSGPVWASTLLKYGIGTTVDSAYSSKTS